MITSGILQYGSFSVFSTVWDRDFNIVLQKPCLKPNAIGSFKVINESTFFDTYNSNAAVKANVYNNLRINALNVLNDFKRNQSMLANVSAFVPLDSNITGAASDIFKRRAELFSRNNTLAYSYVGASFKRLYPVDSTIGLGIDVTFDTSTLKSQVLSSNPTNANMYLYPFYVTSLS